MTRTLSKEETSRQVAAIEKWLRIFHPHPGAVVELRALRVGGKKAVCQCFNDTARLARRAAELDAAGAAGCYFTLNPLRPELAGASVSARKEDVLRRHWLPLDCDPVRAKGQNSTDAEKAAAWAVLDRARGLLDAAGLAGAVVGDSGNGWHLCHPIDLPNDDDAQALVKAIAEGAARRCDDAQAVIDPMHDAPRIWKLYGTTARKGPEVAEAVDTSTGKVTPARPWRWARLIEGEPWDAATAKRNTEALRLLLATWKRIDDMRRGRPADDEGLSVPERARRYVEKMPPAVSGQGGHAQTFLVAEVLARGFALPREHSWPILSEYNARCLPPWTEKDLLHKIEDAETKSKLPLGYLLAERPHANGHHKANGFHANGTHHAAGGAPKPPPRPDPWEPPIPLHDDDDPAAFPLSVLPPPLRQFVEEGAWALNCPPDFIAVPMLTAAGAAVGNSTRLIITRTHTQGAVTFSAIVGIASSGKSPALELVLQPFESAQHRFYEEWKIRHDLWKSGDRKDEEPTLRQLLADDATAEALARLMSANPRGVLMALDEVAALVSGLNQYKSQGGNDRQFYLKLWPQATIRAHRVKNEDGVPLVVRQPFLAITGGVQPSVITTMRAAVEAGRPVTVEDGFLDRWLWSFPVALPAVGETWREVSLAATSAWDGAVRRLLALPLVIEEGKPKPTWLGMANEAKLVWKSFTDAHAAELNDPDFPPHLVGPWGKLRGYCGRLALVLHLLRDACGERVPTAVDAESLRRAVELIAYFKSHARRVYQAIGRDQRTVGARRVLSWLKRWDLPTVNRRDILRALQRHFASVEELSGPLTLLQQYHYLRPVLPKPTGGRPGSPIWEINPYIVDSAKSAKR